MKWKFFNHQYYSSIDDNNIRIEKAQNIQEVVSLVDIETYLDLCFVTTCLKHKNLLLSNRVKLSLFPFLFFAW